MNLYDDDLLVPGKDCVTPDFFWDRGLCILAIDTSGSMNADGAINEINDALKRFMVLINSDETLQNHLDVGIITFNSSVKIISEPIRASYIEFPTLKAQGSSNIVKGIETAINMVERTTKIYKQNNIFYCCPWIILMTDGDPYPNNQDINNISQKIKEDSENSKYRFSVLSVGKDVQDLVLTMLATKDFPIHKISEIDFNEYDFTGIIGL